MSRKGNVLLRCNDKALGIVRVSSNRQKDKITFQTQRDAINLYASQKGLNILKTVEIVESAKDPDNRKKYDDAVGWAIENKVYNVLFYCQD
ncbi:MAG TPA: recombinase family protein, partial [bacterium]|nr:recombinase family protein [bacterium]